MSAPYSFENLNQFESHIVPGVIKPSDNALAAYYRRWLGERAFAIFEFDGIPENWDVEYLKWCLLCFGTCAVLKTDKFGIIPQQCGISGYNVFYRPTRAIVVNPLFERTYDLQIGTDCELIRLTPDWRGIADIIGHYADLLAVTVTSIITNLYNTRLSYVFTAGSKSIAESFKLLYDKVARGEPAVFADNKLMGEDGKPNWQPFQQDITSTYIVDKLQSAEKSILYEFYSHIGIPNVPFEKNERLNMDETSMNSYATICLVDLWRRTLTATLSKVNKMFGLNVSVKYNDELRKEVETNGNDGRPDVGGTGELQT